MKVITKKRAYSTLSDVSYGECFLLSGDSDVYLKLTETDPERYNAVNLNCGYLTKIKNTAEVIPIDATLSFR